MVGLSFYGIFWEFLVIGESNIKILATKFSPLFLFHCHNQVAKLFTLISRLFCLLQKGHTLYEKKKLRVNIVEPKLQETILYATKRDVQLEPCIAPSVPTFQHCPRMIWIIM